MISARKASIVFHLALISFGALLTAYAGIQLWEQNPAAAVFAFLCAATLGSMVTYFGVKLLRRSPAEKTAATVSEAYHKAIRARWGPEDKDGGA